MSTEPNEATADPALRIADEIRALVDQGDLPRALEIANRAIGRGLRHPLFFMVRAQRAEELGNLQFALEDYERAAAAAPDDAGVQAVLGACAMRVERYLVAVHAFNAAVELEPTDPNLHYRLGVAHAHAGDHEAAQRAHERAIECDPQFAGALASLATITSRKGETEKARELANRALAIDPQHPTALVALVQLDISARRHAEAETRLRDLLAMDVLLPTNRPSVVSMLGDTLDSQKKYAEAFTAYTEANNELRARNAPKFTGNIAPEAVRNQIVFFENEDPKRWAGAPDTSPVDGEFEGHVFLLGFMRSGTTLLEQVLASNPDIVALEEKGLLFEQASKYQTSFRGLDMLAALSGEELAEQRRSYWRRVRNHLPDSTARIFVDKQPLNTTRLPVISKLFPKARVLFAIRDPRDVVFSCFRRHFRVAATQYEFLSIESCARIYSSIMRLGEVSREKLPLNVLDHRYEAMVEDFEGRVRAVCDFIGVEWSDTMRNFSEHRLVADLRSPSATQVRRPLYGEGVGQWRRYGEQLKPILPILEPWVVKFGYPRD